MERNELEKEMLAEYEYSRPRALVNGCMALLTLAIAIVGFTYLIIVALHFIIG